MNRQQSPKSFSHGKRRLRDERIAGSSAAGGGSGLAAAQTDRVVA